MTIEEMRSRRRELGYTYEMLSEASGVPVATIQKIFSGTTQAPRRDTIIALENVLRRNSIYTLADERTPLEVREEVAKYKVKDGDYTGDILDGMDLPEDFRFDLIDGQLYYLATPTIDHQTVVEEVYLQIRDHIKKNKGKCIVRDLPTTLEFDEKNRPIPDLFILCDKSKLGGDKIYGAPDFIMEVLSPSTRLKDLTVKLNCYAKAGVREIWFADLKNEKVIVYTFNDPEDNIINIYTFSDEIPVAIFDGRLKIDMKAVKKAVDDFYE